MQAIVIGTNHLYLLGTSASKILCNQSICFGNVVRANVRSQLSQFVHLRGKSDIVWNIVTHSFPFGASVTRWTLHLQTASGNLARVRSRLPCSSAR